jgi:hypothetical protein
VLVLGSYTAPHLYELRDVARALSRLRYAPRLLSDLPEIAYQSNEEKLRMWGLVCRFATMVDRVASGHVAEYGMLRDQRTILGVCRPDNKPSTFMIGDDALVDVNYIRIFPFARDTSAASLMPDVSGWAESVINERSSAYSEAYPWRR